MPAVHGVPARAAHHEREGQPTVLVRMRTHISGTRNGQEWPAAGSVIELPDDEAAEYCRRGDAEPVTTFRDAETTTLTRPAETRTPTAPLTTRTGPRGGKAGR